MRLPPSPFGWQIPHSDPLASLGAPASLSTVISACLPPPLPAQCHFPSRVAADGQVRRNSDSCATSAVGLGWYHHLSRRPCLLLRIEAHWFVTWLMSKRKKNPALAPTSTPMPRSPLPTTPTRVCVPYSPPHHGAGGGKRWDGFHSYINPLPLFPSRSSCLRSSPSQGELISATATELDETSVIAITT